MIAFLIDDEPLILSHHETLLKEFPSIREIYKMTTATEALKQLKSTKVDLIFLDIEMPGKSGIELAKEIRELCPQVKIVFLTAYSEYALNSYDVEALDYVVKPLTKERILRVLKRLQNHYPFENQTQFKIPDGYIRLLGGLEFELPNGEKVPVKWRTSKAREVFSYLLHNRGLIVSKDSLIQEFWVGSDSKRQFDQLYATVYQIRKTLASLPFAIQLENKQEGYVLHLNGVELDVEQLENGLKASQLKEVELSLSFYRGDYLQECMGIWVENERERLRTLWCSECEKLAKHYDDQGDASEAITILLKVQDMCPYEEEIYFKLMKLYAKKKERFLVMKQYNRLSKMLAEEYATEPDKQVVNWYNAWERSLS